MELLAWQEPAATLYSPEGVFGIANNVVLPGWLLLVFLPRWWVTRWVVHAGVLPFLLSIVYLGIVGPAIAQGGMDFRAFGSLAGVMGLFQNPWVVVAGWVHYLAFDLWTGAWQVRDSAKVGIHHLLVIPCLLLTFMLGPVGLGAYLLIRWIGVQRFENEA